MTSILRFNSYLIFLLFMQEKVVEFSHMNPIELLEKTEQAVSIYDKHVCDRARACYFFIHSTKPIMFDLSRLLRPFMSLTKKFVSWTPLVGLDPQCPVKCPWRVGPTEPLKCLWRIGPTEPPEMPLAYWTHRAP